MAFRTRKPSNQVAPPPERQQNSSPTPLQNPNYHPDDFFTLCNILKDPKIQPGRPYKSYRTGIEPELGLIQAVFDHFNPSSKLLHCLIQWRICLERKENLILPVVYCLVRLVEIEEGIWFLVTLLRFWLEGIPEQVIWNFLFSVKMEELYWVLYLHYNFLKYTILDNFIGF
jgi:hypothetical protein